ncbi:MAG: NADH-quinone oxidoreductase subunit L, partial [Candidatus Tectomicrobia bacterium]|nr:NADH-quinone oxidoreductase subunit L [Candidatus Tectomicrobia bacterium]
MIRYAWLIPLFPVVGVLVNGLLGSRVREKAGHVASLMAGLSFLAALGVSREMIMGPGGSHTVTLWTWITAGDLKVSVSFLIDPLSTIMLLVVAGVG